MIHQAMPDKIAVLRAKLQIAGVSFNAAHSVDRGVLRDAAESEDSFRKLIERLLRKPS